MDIVKEGLAVFITLCFSSICLADIPPNRSFESGDLSPDSWSLSGGKGAWESTGHEGKRSVSVTGTGEDSNYWRCDECALVPHQTYRVSFAARVGPDASGGTVMTGSNIANRDYSIGKQWEKRSFVFTAPHDTADAFLRFGQWQKSGKVWFDDIELRPVVALHHHYGSVELGEGETIQNGTYKARPNFQGEGSNSSRTLFSHTASFNSNRWVIGDDSEVIYKHRVGEFQQSRASVTVEIGYYQGGKCVVEASSDGQEWHPIGELAGLTHQTFAVPERFFPSSEIFIRLRGMKKDDKSASLQVYGYSYEAQLANGSVPDMTGDTRYLDIVKSSDNLDVAVLSLGDLRPGGDSSVRLRLTNRSSAAMSVVATAYLSSEERAEHVKSVNSKIEANETKEVSVDYEISRAGDFEIFISISESTGKTLHALRTFFHVPQLYSADYGYLLSRGEEFSIWWAEATHKISRERPLPVERKDGIYLSAARNEYEPFQLVLRPNRDMENVSVEMSELTTPDGQSISGDNVDVSVVGYVCVKVPTDKVGCVGYWPDPLLPYRSPLSLRAGQNQPIWITIYVPPDAVAGDYAGNLIVSGESWSEKIPVRLHVWDFSLTRETHVRSALGFSTGSVKRYHNLETDEELKAIVDKYYQNFSDHRISPYNPMDLYPIEVKITDSDPADVEIDFDVFDSAARRYFDEMGLSSLRLPLRGMGGGTFHSRRLGEMAGHKQGTPEHEAIFTKYLRQIQDHLRENGWLEKAFVYWFDEPDPKDYQFVKDGMDLIHRAAPEITRLLTEQPESELYGSVDIWCPVTHHYNHEKAEERRKAGDHFWWYVCTGPKEPYCTLFIDHYATELRLWLWQTWKYGVEGILVWQSNYWTSPLAFPAPSLQNPYVDPMSYQSGYGRPVGYIGYWGNGDGRFLYPPVEAMENREAKCMSGPVNSIRWEMLREGIEDYEYFWLLRERIEALKESGEPAELLIEAEKLLTVPEDIVASMTEFTINPQPIYAHREKIARMIEKLKQ